MAGLSDPTLAFLASLRDPRRYARLENVPIFGPHVRKGRRPDGREYEIEVQTDELTDIVAQMRRLAASGVLTRGTLGHIDPQLPEPLQPETVAYFADPHLGTFGPAGKPAILATVYVPRDKLAEVRGYPYRSAEYYPQGTEHYPGQPVITGVAFLKRDPYLELGMVDVGAMAYAGGRFPCLHYAMENSGMADEKTEAEQKDRQAEGLSPDEEKRADAYMAHYKQKHPFMAYAAKCYEASLGGEAGSAMGPTNATPPKPGEGQGYAPATAAGNRAMWAQVDQEGERVRTKGGGSEYDDDAMSGNWAARSHAAAGGPVNYAAELQRLQAQVAQLTRERETTACQRMVEQLAAEGYAMDAATEVSVLLPLDAASRMRRIQYVRDHYRNEARDGGFVAVYKGAVEGNGPASDPHRPTPHQEKATQYLYAHPGATWDESLAATAGK